MKRYIVDGNVTDTRHVVGFASERLFVDYTDHAALLCAVANEVKKLPKRHDYESYVVWRLDFDEAVGKVLAMLEVE